jgi:probable F420-dependent oxidoreductase
MDHLGEVGIWSRELRFGDPVEAVEAAAELEELGFGALWIPGGDGGTVLDTVATMLRATRRAVVATGILNVWAHDPEEVARVQAELDHDHPGRFLLGLGVGHAPIVDAHEPGRYRKPVATMRAYLDALDEHSAADAAPARVVAALAPRMIALARERTLGVHPYMVPVSHTRFVREALGPGRLVAPELSVVLEPDLGRARREARQDLALYLTLPNYTNTWLRLGFTDADLADGGSERLIDALYALGSAGQVAARVREHRDAGADHVCLRVVTNTLERLPRAEWRELAAALAG